MSPDLARVGWKGRGIKVAGIKRCWHPWRQIRQDLGWKWENTFLFLWQLSQWMHLLKEYHEGVPINITLSLALSSVCSWKRTAPPITQSWCCSGCTKCEGYSESRNTSTTPVHNVGMIVRIQWSYVYIYEIDIYLMYTHIHIIDIYLMYTHIHIHISGALNLAQSWRCSECTKCEGY